MGKIRRFLRNVSIKKAFLVTMILTVIVAVLASFLCGYGGEMMKQPILEALPINQELYENGVSIMVRDYEAITPENREILDLIDAASILLTVLSVVLITLSSSVFFYRWKLKKPLALLEEGALQIRQNNLDWKVEYESRDEMGRLCGAFEEMRKELCENNRQMWQMMEQRRRLNAAFAHDLRTPVTVLKGYTEFLKTYLPQGRLTPEKTESTLSFMTESVGRLEQYLESVNDVQKLEEIQPAVDSLPGEELLGELKSCMEMLAAQHGKTLGWEQKGIPDRLAVDQKLLFRVAGNLTENALRYAEKGAAIQVSVRGGRLLQLEVSDDGRGFSREDLAKAAEPYYKDAESKEGHHMGLGLHICRILCEKHGGSLRLDNRPEGGAVVTAAFFMDVDKK